MAIVYSKPRSEVLIQILNSLERNAGITSVSPGSVARAFAEAVSDQVGDLYSILKYNIDQTMLATASGRNLDLIGELYSVRRKQVSSDIVADRQVANVLFSIAKPYSRDIIIPADTLVYNDVSADSSFQFNYRLVGAVTITASTTRAYGQLVPAFTNQAHTAAVGSLVKHNFLSPPGVVVMVYNPKEIHSQIDYESDESYRRRIIRSVKINSSGTTESIRLAALSVSGVRDVRIREASFGLGSCDVIVVPESAQASATLDKSVYTQLQTNKPVGVRMNVRVAQREPVSVVANITLPSGIQAANVTAIGNQAAYFTKRYLNSLTIGDTLNINVLKSQISAASDLITDVIINGITVNGVEIPIENYILPSERSYLVAGLVSIYPAIIGQPTY
jgi:uncharacterized phage protein gp47/JayE